MFLHGMASIYANAYLTIVAGEGADGDHGIPGIGRCSKPRNTLCSEIRFPGHTLSLGPHCEITPALYCTNEAWPTRGWTLQESYLSRRLLVFTSIARFHCEKHTSVEWDLNPHGIGDSWVDRTSFVCNVPNWPDISHFIKVVKAYSQRRLSFDDDILHAFTGVTTVLNQSFHSGFPLRSARGIFRCFSAAGIGLAKARSTSNSENTDIITSELVMGEYEGFCQHKGLGAFRRGLLQRYFVQIHL